LFECFGRVGCPGLLDGVVVLGSDRLLYVGGGFSFIWNLSGSVVSCYGGGYFLGGLLLFMVCFGTCGSRLGARRLYVWFGVCRCEVGVGCGGEAIGFERFFRYWAWFMP